MVVVIYPKVEYMHYCRSCGVFLDLPGFGYDYTLHRLHGRGLAKVQKMNWLQYRYIPTDIIKKENISGIKVRSQVKVTKTT